MSDPLDSLRLRWLGTIDGVRSGTDSLAFRDRKSLALLARLTLADGAPLSREALAALFWPELPDARARSNLRVTLTRLNRTLGAREPPWLVADRRSVRLNPVAPLHCDAVELERLAREWRGHAHQRLARCTVCHATLVRAEELYRGDFLDGFHLDGCEEFEEWQSATREHLRGVTIEALEALAERHLDRAELDVAERYTQRELALDPFGEKSHRRLMRLLALQDRRSAALTHYASLSERLLTELDIAPDDDTVALYGRIQRGEIRPMAPGAAPPVTPGAVPHNLPTEKTTYIGHEEVRERLFAHLATERLITLTGIGGIGKTRLALQLARNALGCFPDGVFLVRLAPLQEPSGLTSAIASVIGLRFGPGGDTMTQLLEHLATRRLLLVLDNFEHLIDGGAAFVTSILDGTTGVSLLVTSRHKLGIVGEAGYVVPGLNTTPESSTECPDGGLPSAASRLFLDTARRVSLDFSPRADDLVHVERIGRLVGGHPLALVLAAGWLESLSCREVAVELATGIELLETDTRDVPERQRSVEAAFEHSWGSLDEDERAALAAMSVFRGGFDRAAASVVAGVSLRRLGRLVNKSLVLHDAERERYELHELMRQFAAEKLRAANATADAARRHAHHYLGLVDAAAALPEGRRQDALRRLEAEMDNVSAAWLRTVRERDVARLAPSVTPLRSLCALTGHEHDLVGLLEPALSLVGPPLGTSADTPAALERRRQQEFELDLLLALGVAYRGAKGYLDAALSSLFERAWELVGNAEDSAELFAVLYGLWSSNFVHARLERASDITAEWRRRLDAAEVRGDTSDYLEDAGFIVHCLEGPVHYARGEYTSAIERLETGLALERAERRDVIIAVYGLDFAVSGRHCLSCALCHVGRADSGLAAARRARNIAREGGQSLALSFAAMSLTTVSALRGNVAATLRDGAAMRAIVSAHPVGPFTIGHAAFFEGYALAEDDAEAGIAWMLETVETVTGMPVLAEFYTCLLADRLLGVGRVDEALARLVRARASSEANGVSSFHAECVRLVGEGECLRGEIDTARERFEQALGIAREQGALLFELRAASSLVRIEADTGPDGGVSARTLLEEALARFVEGFDTPDLVAARALLAECTERPRHGSVLRSVR